MLPMYFVLPHVFSTKTDQKSIMGLTCHRRQHHHHHRAKCRASQRICECLVLPTTDPWQQRWTHNSCDRWRHGLISELLRQQFGGQHERRQCNVIASAIVQYDDDDNDVVQRIRFVSSAGEEIDRTSVANVVPSTGPVGHLRWPGDQLCVGAARIYRRPRSACDCVPHLALGRSEWCQRIEVQPIVSERRRSSLCVLQSNPLVSSLPIRWVFVFSSYFLLVMMIIHFSL